MTIKRLSKNLLIPVILILITIIVEPIRTWFVDLFQSNNEKSLITTKMIIDSVTTSYVKYYFEISNTGDVNIENIMTSIRTPDYFNEQRDLESIPKIAIGDKISLYPIEYTIPALSPLTFNRANIFFKIELDVIFNKEGENDNKSFFQFIYNIPWGAITVKEYYPTKTTFKDTIITSKKNLPIEVFNGLEKNSGSQYWVLKLPFESEGDTVPLVITNNKVIYLIKSLQKIVFWRKLSNGKEIQLTNNYKIKGKNLYLFSMIWSDSLTKFTVDSETDSVLHFN